MYSDQYDCKVGDSNLGDMDIKDEQESNNEVIIKEKENQNV